MKEGLCNERTGDVNLKYQEKCQDLGIQLDKYLRYKMESLFFMNYRTMTQIFYDFKKKQCRFLNLF